MPEALKSLAAVLVLTAGLLTTGCASRVAPAADTAVSMSNAIQPEDSRITQSQQARMLIATLSQDTHLQLTGGRPINQMNMSGFKNPPADYERFFADLERQYGARRVADWPLSSIGVRCLVFELSPNRDRGAVIRAMREDKRLETVQVMQSFSVLGESYDDPYLELQHGYRAMSVENSHRWATGKGVNIAIIDTGADSGHEDLRGQFVGVKNFVNVDATAFANDLHGTGIAGVIAARADNGTGIAGIAPDARLWALKACWQTRADDIAATCSTFTLAKAINFAVQQQVDVINLSLAGPSDPLLERLLALALKRDIAVVVAVSNDPVNTFPAGVPGVIAVTGPHSEDAAQAVSAPADNIISTRPGNGYDYFTGSSFSTAHISGVVALIKQRRPHLRRGVLHDLLRQSQARFRGAGADEPDGTPNACHIIASVIGTACDVD